MPAQARFVLAKIPEVAGEAERRGARRMRMAKL